MLRKRAGKGRSFPMTGDPGRPSRGRRGSGGPARRKPAAPFAKRIAADSALRQARRDAALARRLAAELKASCASLDLEASRLRRIVERRDGTIGENEQRLRLVRGQLDDARREKQDLLASASWRFAAPLRLASKLARRARAWSAKLVHWASTPELTAHRARHLFHLLALRRTRRASIGRAPTGPGAAQGEGLGPRALEQACARMADSGFAPCVVVPVYNGADELDLCIRSLLRHTGRDARIVLIDDASPDPRVGRLLAGLAGDARIEVFRNKTNQGFTRTVNRGIELAGRADVVLLNADTEVTPFWLRNLRLAAYSTERTASATPFSDNAGAFSAPAAGEKNTLPAPLAIDDAARLVGRAAERLYPQAPTGNGFCMYLRRAALDAVGPFDAEAFPRGYGEENDWSRRAARAGWRHVIDDATYIRHVRTVSFGAEKTALVQAGRALLDARYPDYTALVRLFGLDRRVAAARLRVGQALAQGGPVRPRALFVISTQTGGTPQTNRDLMAALQDRYETLVLRCDAETVELSRFRLDAEGARVQDVLERVGLALPLKAFPHQSASYDEAVRWLLLRHGVELVHIRHIGWHGLNLPSLARELELPVVFSFHDFYTVCPNIKLLDENNDFCAGACTPTPGECAHELWTEPDFPPLKHRAIGGWQAAMGAMLTHCDAFATTGEGARRQILKTYPRLAEKPFAVIEHGRDLVFTQAAAAAPGPEERVRVLVPGNIGVAKGSLVLEGLDRLDRDGRFEFHVLGNTNIRERGHMVFHGPYRREEFAARAAAIRPHFGLILSLWPETYCHTLSELWAATIPVAAFDTGAVGERIAATGGGWLLPVATAQDRDPAAVLERLRAVAADRSRADRIEAVRAWQKLSAGELTTAHMAERYHRLYREAAASP